MTTRSFSGRFNITWFGGGASASTEVPGVMPVALHGHMYRVALDEYERATVDQLRDAQDTSAVPGEQSFNPKGLWRKVRNDWSLGAGQIHADRDNERTSPRRYRDSRGVDPWEPEKLTLLPGTERKITVTATNHEALAVGTRVYFVDGTDVKFTPNPGVTAPTSSTIQAGEGAQTVNGIASDGASVWAALGTNGIHVTAVGASTSTHFSAFAATGVWYANGRLLAALDNNLVEIDGSGVVSGLDFDHRSLDFEWRGVIGMPNGIYAWGDAGDRSEIFYMSVDPDTGGLRVPIHAGGANDGEIINVVAGYGDNLLVGTTRGLRLGTARGEFIDLNSVIEVTGGVTALEPQAEFCWFSMAQLDAGNTGLGRANLAEFIPGFIAPAYAPDLQAIGTTGVVSSIITFGGKRLFTVVGSGLWGQTDNLVASGWVDSGWVSHGTIENKVPIEIDLHYAPLDGSIDVALRYDYDEAALETIGVADTADSRSPVDPFHARRTPTRQVSVRITLNRDAGVPTTGPELHEWTLRSLPSAARIDQFLVPLIVEDRVPTMQGQGRLLSYNTLEEFRFLKGLENGVPVLYQEGDSTYEVRVDRVLLRHPAAWNNERSFFNGRIYVELVTLEN